MDISHALITLTDFIENIWNERSNSLNIQINIKLYGEFCLLACAVSHWLFSFRWRFGWNRLALESHQVQVTKHNSRNPSLKVKCVIYFISSMWRNGYNKPFLLTPPKNVNTVVLWHYQNIGLLVWAVLHSNFGSTNGVGLEQSYLFSWPVEDVRLLVTQKLHTSPLKHFDVVVNAIGKIFCITELKFFTHNDTCACVLACFPHLEKQHMPKNESWHAKKIAGIVMCFVI